MKSMEKPSDGQKKLDWINQYLPVTKITAWDEKGPAINS